MSSMKFHQKDIQITEPLKAELKWLIDCVIDCPLLFSRSRFFHSLSIECKKKNQHESILIIVISQLNDCFIH